MRLHEFIQRLSDLPPEAQEMDVLIEDWFEGGCNPMPAAIQYFAEPGRTSNQCSVCGPCVLITIEPGK